MSDSWFDRMMVAALPKMPKWMVWRVAKRYVAGESLAEAMATVRRLESWGARATIDVLGEEINDIEMGSVARDDYIQVLNEVARLGLATNVSIKLTAFGLRLDPERCYQNARAVVAHAAAKGNFVRIDMEDSTTTSHTLAIFKRLRQEGFVNVGVVLQAYMRRTLSDVQTHANLQPNYRLCKGIYVEAENVAYQTPEEIRDNYQAVLSEMFSGGSYVGIATHDHAVVQQSLQLLKKHQLTTHQYEFQMLLGVDENLGRQLVQQGHVLRVYVPFGKDWLAYCRRRLKENPRIARYILWGLVRR